MLTGKIALVTGASRGIGKEIAVTLAKNGATIIVNYNGSRERAEEVVKAIEEKTGKKATLINPRYITGLDKELLEELKKDHTKIITLEDGILDGGFGEKIARFYGPSDMKVYNYGLKKEFIDRYVVEEVLKENRITVEQMLEDIFSV